jgi:uncharacterized protein YjbJ (UPF0337 family)
MNKNQIEGSVMDLTGKVQQEVARATGNANRINAFRASGEDARMVEEIRRRQRSLALRYVVALRAR